MVLPLPGSQDNPLTRLPTQDLDRMLRSGHPDVRPWRGAIAVEMRRRMRQAGQSREQARPQPGAGFTPLDEGVRPVGLEVEQRHVPGAGAPTVQAGPAGSADDRGLSIQAQGGRPASPAQVSDSAGAVGRMQAPAGVGPQQVPGPPTSTHQPVPAPAGQSPQPPRNEPQPTSPPAQGLRALAADTPLDPVTGKPKAPPIPGEKPRRKRPETEQAVGDRDAQATPPGPSARRPVGPGGAPPLPKEKPQGLGALAGRQDGANTPPRPQEKPQGLSALAQSRNDAQASAEGGQGEGDDYTPGVLFHAGLGMLASDSPHFTQQLAAGGKAALGYVDRQRQAEQQQVQAAEERRRWEAEYEMDRARLLAEMAEQQGQPPKTREIKSGGKVKTQAWDGGRWRTIAEAPRWEDDGGASDLSDSQRRKNAMIDQARRTLADRGLSREDIQRLTQKSTETGRENPQYEPQLDNLLNLATQRKYGEDPDFPQVYRRYYGQQPAAIPDAVGAEHLTEMGQGQPAAQTDGGQAAADAASDAAPGTDSITVGGTTYAVLERRDDGTLVVQDPDTGRKFRARPKE